MQTKQPCWKTESNSTEGKLRTPVRRAFTLIELLVVIAIIALLAAILFPVFARARENARKSSCSNNLRQMALGIAQYVQDFDELYPTSNSTLNLLDSTWTTPLNWPDPMRLVDPYLKSTQILICPSDSGGNAVSMKNATPRGNSYGMNDRFSTTAGTAMANVVEPTRIILLYDGLTTRSRLDMTSQINHAKSRHLDGCNFAFADGHVKWMKLSKFVGAKYFGDYPVYDSTCAPNTFYRTRIDAKPGVQAGTGLTADCSG